MTTETLIAGNPDPATAADPAAPASTPAAATDPANTPADPSATPAAADPATDPATPDPNAPKGELDKDGKPKAADPKPAGAPEQYEDFKAPDGVKLDADTLGEFKTLAKELNLPQDQAQKVADIGVKLSQKWAADHQTAVQGEQAKWLEASKTDKEFGGDKLTESVTVAKAAINEFATPELKTLLEDTKLGNHPEVIRLFNRIGKAVTSGKLVPAGKPAATKSTADRLYKSA